MATLHLIHQNLISHPELAQQLASALSEDDALLFIAQGLYSLAALPLSYQHPVYVLKSDVQVTGFHPPLDSIQMIDYDEFVALGVRYERSLSWN